MLLTEADLDKLRSLRADLASLLRPADRPRDVTLLPSASVSVRVGADGAALLEPRGDGSRRVSATASPRALGAPDAGNRHPQSQDASGRLIASIGLVPGVGDT
jgi:hypothetical protein